jgi:hypothetical protein
MFFEEALGPSGVDAGKPVARMVLAAALGSPRAAQGAMKALSALLPLDASGLAHLKRIKPGSSKTGGPGSSGGSSLEVLLAPPEVWYALPDAERKQLCALHQLGPPVEVRVPAHPAGSRDEFDAAHAEGWWPQTFHPATTAAGLPLPPADAAAMLPYLWAALADRAAGGDKGSNTNSVRGSSRGSNGKSDAAGGLPAGGVLVNPRTGEVLACASRVRAEMARRCPAAAAPRRPSAPRTASPEDSIGGNGPAATIGPAAGHPLHTATMLCVHGLAWCHQASRGKSSSTNIDSGSVDGGQATRVKRPRDDSGGSGARAASLHLQVQSPALVVAELAPFAYGLELALLGAVPWHALPGAQAAAKAAAAAASEAEATAAGGAAAGAMAPLVGVAAANGDDGSDEEVPYLCTGLDLYLTHEVGTGIFIFLLALASLTVHCSDLYLFLPSFFTFFRTVANGDGRDGAGSLPHPARGLRGAFNRRRPRHQPPRPHAAEPQPPLPRFCAQRSAAVGFYERKRGRCRPDCCCWQKPRRSERFECPRELFEWPHAAGVLAVFPRNNTGGFLKLKTHLGRS